MTERTRTWLFTGVILVALGILFVMGWSQRGRFSPLDAGAAAPDFAARTLAGDTVRLSEFRGRVVLLNLWATWCGPCRWEMPALERLHRELGHRGLAIVALSLDAAPGRIDAFGNPGGDVRAFVDELGLTFAVLLDPDADVQRRYAVAGLPTTFLIDRAGRIVEKVLGPAAWDEPPHPARIRRLLED